MVKIYLTRHGETIENSRGLFQGHAPGHLSDKGKEQAAQLGVTLKDMTYVSQHLRNQVEVLKDQLKKWICEHYEYYPLADVCACNCDCCHKQPKLNAPNPNQQLYRNLRRCVDLM